MTSRTDPAGQARPQDFGSLVTGLVSVASRSIEGELRGRGFSVLEYSIVRALDESGQANSTQLSHLLPVEMSSISRAVANLVDNGYVRRNRRRDDRRVVMLSLTPAGRELAEELRNQVNENYETLLTGISERELNAFTSVVHRILDNHSEASRNG